MRRIVLLAFIFITLGCTPEAIDMNTEATGTNTEVPAKAEDVFFVRYAASSAGASVSYTKEDGTNITVTNASTDNGTFVRTVGPVYKGFSCTFRVNKSNMDYYEIPVRIEVKRNDEPFVVKVEGQGSVKYTIN